MKDNKEEIKQIFNKLNESSEVKPTKEELSYLLTLYEREDNSEFMEVFNEWASNKWSKQTGADEAPNFEFILSKLNLGKSHKEQKKIRVLLFSTLQRVAAVLFIPLAIGFAYYYFSNSSVEEVGEIVQDTVEILPMDFTTPQVQEYYSPAGTRSKIVLKDSTVVWLNSASKLLISESYGDKQRGVKLSGQAFFDVKTNKDIPFIVDLGNDLRMTVTGTKFSVKAYEEMKQVESVLISGIVKISNKENTYQMHPSEKVVLERSSNFISVESVDDESYRSWKDGILVFKGSKMTDVVSTLEKWFNVSISIENSELYTYVFTAKLDNCSLEQVLDYISLSSPIKYTVKERRVKLTKTN